MDFLERYGQENEPYVCASCGNCTLVCPVFRDLKWESYGPRGKLHIAKSIMEGEGEFGEDFARKIFLCNLCEHCTSVCTTGINLDRFAGRKSNPRNFAQTRRELKKDMFGSVSLGSVLTGVAVIGSILWLSNRK